MGIQSATHLITRSRQPEAESRVVVLQHRDVVVQVGQLASGVAQERAEEKDLDLLD